MNARLEDIIKIHRPGLYRQDTRKRASEQILESLKETLENLKDDERSVTGKTNEKTPVPSPGINDSQQSCEKTLLLLVHALGPDIHLRKWMLDLIATKESMPITSRKVLVQILPTIVPDDLPDKDVVKEAQKTLCECAEAEPSLLLEVMHSLAMIGDGSDHATLSVLLGMEHLHRIDDALFPLVMVFLLQHVRGDEDSIHLIDRIRTRSFALSDDIGYVVAASQFVSTLEAAEPAHQEKLVDFYLDVMSDDDENIEHGILLFDLMLFCYVTSNTNRRTQGQDILGSWVSTGKFPFDSMKDCLNLIQNGTQSAPLNILLNGFVSITLFLTTSQQRMSVSRQQQQEISGFVSGAASALKGRYQTELIEGLFCLARDTSNDRETTCTKKRTQLEMTEAAASTHLVHKFVCSVVCHIAESSPTSLHGFSDYLLKSLSTANFSQTSLLSQTYFKILARLERKHSERDSEHVTLASIVKKLLYATGGNEDSVTNGINLATECINSKHVNEEEKQSFATQVERIMLPSTRRVVCPTTGAAGVRFWLEWTRYQGSTAITTVFDHVRMVLSNMGLLQEEQQYRRRGYRYQSQMCYFNTNDDHGSPGKQRRVVFCITYVARSSFRSPSKWIPSAKWVFEVSNAYLDLGRRRPEKGKWKVDRWLTSALEFPAVDVPDRGDLDIQHWLSHLFNNWNISGTCSRSKLKSFFQEAGSELTPLLDSTMLFSSSLLHGMAVLMAVIKNAFEYEEQVLEGSEEREASRIPMIRELIQNLYIMRTKARQLQVVLETVASMKHPRKIAPTILEATSELDAGIQALFASPFFLEANFLWRLSKFSVPDSELCESLDRFERDPIDFPKTSDHFFIRRSLAEHIIHIQEAEESCHFTVDNSVPFNCLLRLAVRCIDGLHRIKLKMRRLRSKTMPNPENLLNGGSDDCFRELECLTYSFLHLARNTVRQDPTISIADNKRYYLNLCDGKQSEPTASGTPSEIFYVLARRLSMIDNVFIMNEVLEILALIAIRSKGRPFPDLMEINRRALFTIFSDSEPENASWESDALVHIHEQANVSLKSQELRSTTSKMLHRFVHPAGKSPMPTDSQHFRLCSIRLLCNSCQPGDPSLVEDARRLVFHVERYISSLAETYAALPNKRKRTPTSAIAALAPSSFHFTFIDMLRFVSLSIVWCDLKPNDSCGPQIRCGPYQDFVELQKLYCRLFVVYRKEFAVFPKSLLTNVLEELSSFVAIVVVQLSESADWRNAQPLLTAQEKREKKIDHGAMVYFEGLVKATTVTLDLVKREAAEELIKEDIIPRTKIAQIRTVLKKARDDVRQIAVDHNLDPSPPKEDFSIEAEPLEEPQVVEGFHAGEISGKRQTLQEIDIQSEHNRNESMPSKSSVASSNDSFEADGDWADDHSECSMAMGAPVLVMRE